MAVSLQQVNIYYPFKYGNKKKYKFVLIQM